MMQYAVGNGSRPSEDVLLRAMFSERKRVFVDLLRWDVPVLEGQFEIDQFDGPTTIYLIIAGRDGEHRGSMRLLPSTGPHVLGSIFASLCFAAPPCASDIWEISRFCLSRRLRAPERRLVRNQLVTAAARFALDNAIAGYSCVADRGWITQIGAFGWHCEPLGMLQRLDCGLVGAMKITIGADTPALMRAAGTWAATDMLVAGGQAA
jgi:acyl-homoserine lactone synthase